MAVGADQVDADVADSDWLAHGEPLAWSSGQGSWVHCGPVMKGYGSDLI